MPQLNMPPCSLSVRTKGDSKEVFDFVRRQWVVLTPEEWVRQHVLHTLVEVMGYPQELLKVEGSISMNELTRRCDVVVYGKDACPKMIVECKKPQVDLSQKVVDQACRYNTVLDVPFLYLTNGMNHLILKVLKSECKLVQLHAMPSWEEINS